MKTNKKRVKCLTFIFKIVGICVLAVSHATCLAVAEAANGEQSGKLEVTGINAFYRHGQTFVTFRDAAEGAAGADLRYSLYRSDQQITPENFAKAELCYAGILNNSAKMFGAAFKQDARQNPDSPRFDVLQDGQLVSKVFPTFKITEDGLPLPMWSGLAVRTVQRDQQSYYAVVATDTAGRILTTIVPGASATTKPVDEKVAPIQPFKLLDSIEYGRYREICKITGAKNLPLSVSLHASNATGGGAGSHGDYYFFFATPEMGWRDGLPGVFSIEERTREGKNGERHMILTMRDTIESPSGNGTVETFWFGYYCKPQNIGTGEARAWPFTENRTMWIVDWVSRQYGVDTNRVTVYGGSMGAWGTTTFAFRHPELFAAVYPDRPRTRQKGMPSLLKFDKQETAFMPDGKTPYMERMDMVKFASEHPADLPFYCWGCGLRDGFATFQEQIDMVKALTAAHHGFAFAWNDGDHSSGSAAIHRLKEWYAPDKFALNKSYPAFGNSSINPDFTSGVGDAGKDPKNLPVYYINGGFAWSDVVDQVDAWEVTLSNELCEAPMTVDVTPRRCQQFKLSPGKVCVWQNSTGGNGEIAVDKNGLVTVPAVMIKPKETTRLSIKVKN